MKKDDKKKLSTIDYEALEESLEDFAEYYSSTMELIESCDWDEDKALGIFEAVLDGLTDIYDFSKYDPSLISSAEDLEKLLRMNTDYGGEEITDAQFKAVMNLLLIRARQERAVSEYKKQLN